MGLTRAQIAVHPEDALSEAQAAAMDPKKPAHVMILAGSVAWAVRELRGENKEGAR